MNHTTHKPQIAEETLGKVVRNLNGPKQAGMVLASMLLAGTATMGAGGGTAHADAHPTAPPGPTVPGPKAREVPGPR